MNTQDKCGSVQLPYLEERNGESLKEAWDRISEAHKRIMPWVHIHVVSRSFYYGIFQWFRNSLDMIASGIFLECNEARTHEIINGLANLIVNDPRVECVIDRLNVIEEKLDTLNLEEKTMLHGLDLLQIENDWEPFVRIEIYDQSFLAFVILVPQCLSCLSLFMILLNLKV